MPPPKARWREALGRPRSSVVRSVELGRVVVGGAEDGHDRRARLDLDLVEADGLQRHPDGQLDRAVEAEQLVDRVRVERRVVLPARQLVGVAQQGQRRRCRSGSPSSRGRRRRAAARSRPARRSSARRPPPRPRSAPERTSSPRWRRRSAMTSPEVAAHGAGGVVGRGQLLLGAGRLESLGEGLGPRPQLVGPLGRHGQQVGDHLERHGEGELVDELQSPRRRRLGRARRRPAPGCGAAAGRWPSA